MSLQLLYWCDLIARGQGEKLVLWDWAGKDHRRIFSFLHSNLEYISSEVISISKKYVPFLAPGKLNSGSKEQPQGLSEVMFHWQEVATLDLAMLPQHGNGQTPHGKKNMLFLLYFPCTFEGRDFRYRTRKRSNASSPSLPFAYAWKWLSWHRQLFKVQPAWLGYSEIKLWPSACSSAAHLAFHCSPCYLKRSLQVPFTQARSALPGQLWGNSPSFCKGMMAGGTYIHYHPLPSSKTGRNLSL